MSALSTSCLTEKSLICFQKARKSPSATQPLDRVSFVINRPLLGASTFLWDEPEPYNFTQRSENLHIIESGLAYGTLLSNYGPDVSRRYNSEQYEDMYVPQYTDEGHAAIQVLRQFLPHHTTSRNRGRHRDHPARSPGTESRDFRH
jgi:hypothetical protein